MVTRNKTLDQKATASAAKGQPPRGLEPLGLRATIDALRYPDPAVRYWAAGTLAAAGESARPAVAALIEALEDESVGVRIVAAQALGKIESAALRASSALLVAADHRDPLLRSVAIRALGRLGLGAVPFLIEALSSRRVDVRRSALAALKTNLPMVKGRTSSIGVVVALRSAIRDPDTLVRSYAAVGLGMLGADAEPAAADLVEALRDPRDVVRHGAAWALGQLVTHSREASLEDELAQTRFADLATGLVPHLRALLAAAAPELRYIAVSFLAELGEPAADALEEATRDDDLEVREVARQALTSLESRAAVAASTGPRE